MLRRHPVHPAMDMLPSINHEAPLQRRHMLEPPSIKDKPTHSVSAQLRHEQPNLLPDNQQLLECLWVGLCQSASWVLGVVGTDDAGECVWIADYVVPGVVDVGVFCVFGGGKVLCGVRVRVGGGSGALQCRGLCCAALLATIYFWTCNSRGGVTDGSEQ